MADEGMQEVIDDTINVPRGIAESGDPLHEGDRADYIRPMPVLDESVGTYGCLVRLTQGAEVSYQYKSVSLDGEVADTVVAGGELPEALRTALEGDIVPGTARFMPRDSKHFESHAREHQSRLGYVARHLNKGDQQPDMVDKYFSAAMDLLHAVIAITTPDDPCARYGVGHM